MTQEIEEIKIFFGKFKKKFSDELNIEIRDWNKIKEIISFFIDNDEGSPIVDFIDLSNWDSIEKYEFKDNRLLEIIWHDYKSPENDLEISVFGADLIKCEIIIDSIVITGNQGIPVVLIKGYYRDNKEINKFYNSRCSDFKVSYHNPFSLEIIKIVKRKHHIITVPNINCFTVSLVPNCARFISSHDSKKTIYDYNLKVVNDKLISLIGDIASLSEEEQEELQAKGNTVRKNFENALKILNLKAGIKFDNDYQKLMLGDLIKVIKNTDAVSLIGFKLSEVVDILNSCSHDSGIHIKKDNLIKVSFFIIGVINTNYS